MNTIIELYEENFDREVLRSIQPVVVDFWAEWCGPCKMLAPVLEELAGELQGRAIVAKVNVDANPGLAARFNVQSIPTLLFFSGGSLRDRTVGLDSVDIAALVGRLPARSDRRGREQEEYPGETGRPGATGRRG